MLGLQTTKINLFYESLAPSRLPESNRTRSSPGVGWDTVHGSPPSRQGCGLLFAVEFLLLFSFFICIFFFLQDLSLLRDKPAVEYMQVDHGKPRGCHGDLCGCLSFPSV